MVARFFRKLQESIRVRREEGTNPKAAGFPRETFIFFPFSGLPNELVDVIFFLDERLFDANFVFFFK